MSHNEKRLSSEYVEQEERVDLTKIKKVMLVGVYFSSTEKKQAEEYLVELGLLAVTYGFEVVGRMLCPLKKFDARTYIGKGKVEEIATSMKEGSIDALIFDDEISPNQQKNVERTLNKPVIDRTGLILEVFSKRAQTSEAKLQIELAKSRYQLPRLKRLWTHLSRERTGGGASGAFRGAGEKQIEMDKQILKRRISQLRKSIEEIQKKREVQRAHRLRLEVPSFSIVGYTNAGKSTLMNALTDAGVLEEDMLFATLDTTARKYTLPNKQGIVIIDTVGFIRKLSHLLVASFKSTLEEACYTDILLHIIDVSHKAAFSQMEETLKILEELNLHEKPMIVVLNKIDLCNDQDQLARFRMALPKTVQISAKSGEGFDQLLEMMQHEIEKLRKIVSLRIPQSYYQLASESMKRGRVISTEYEDNDILLKVEIPADMEKKLKPFIRN